MTRKSGLARDLEVVNRWCKLAERRLDYLSGLYESGRWKLYHTEQAFVDNIRDAKRAVEAWRLLAKPDGGIGPDTILAARPKPIAFNLVTPRPTQLPPEPMSSVSLLPQATLGER